MLQRISTWMQLPMRHPQGAVFTLYALVSVLSIWLGIALEINALMVVPFALALAWITIVDFKKVFFLLIFCVSWSMEQELPGGFGTDLVSEPLMWLLMLIGGLYVLRNFSVIDGRILYHSITLALLLHIFWIAITSITAVDMGISIKFLLAKLWYVSVFYFFALAMLKTEKDVYALVWTFFVPVFILVCVTLVRHSASGFSFETANVAMWPYFRNKVNYACTLAYFLPFLWYATKRYPRREGLWWFLVVGIAVLLVGINFAYTRAAYIALVAAVFFSYSIKRNWMKPVLFAFALVMGLFISWVTYRDNYYLFQPDFQRTVSHKRFESLLEATTKLEDISVMERVYRWVAASHMIAERPVLGFGPGNFYFNYKNYTLSTFKTYVSANPEKSGIHNYYLMTTVEQGIPGLLIFLLLCSLIILSGQRVYHQTREIGEQRIVLSATLAFIIICLLMLMNDFVETDKIGSFFFITMALIVNQDLKNKRFLKKQAAH